MFKCKKCGNEEIESNHIYCKICGVKLYWVTTAEKLLWLVEAGWFEHNNVMQYIVSKDKDFWYGLHGDYKDIHEAINAAYEWTRAEKAKESKE